MKCKESDESLKKERIRINQNQIMAQSAGFEPATVRLEGGCSIQLSYDCVSDDEDKFYWY